MSSPADDLPVPTPHPSDSATPSPSMGTPVQNESHRPATIVEKVTDPDEEEPGLHQRVKTLLIGRPRDLTDKNVFHHVSLIAFLAWVGLGADGLSSSCYGPPEAFHHLGVHSYLAIGLSLATIFTVLIISKCYSHIIEEFPSGGGGYLVASKLLGAPAGVLSGSALVVDYVLTITVSIAAGGDAMFGLIPPEWQGWKLPCEAAAILLLITLNLRGVKESVKFLLPIFLVFLVTHAILITGVLSMHAGSAAEVAGEMATSVKTSINDPAIGLFTLMGIFLHAYSLGAGTYTGIEAVSNSMPVMREPRVATAKRTMLYMAASLSFMAGGLMIAYLLMGIHPDPAEDKTMNQVLTESFVQESGLAGLGLGPAFLWITILSEGALLFVAAQAGFIDGPRVLANMSQDSYMPHWFGNLSERLATHNGVLLMGLSALAALFYTGGAVGALVVMYSINVFLTFSLSMVGMLRHFWQMRGTNPKAMWRITEFLFGAVLCLGILGVTVYEKFSEGGYITLAVTGACVAACLLTRRYYDQVGRKIQALNKVLMAVPTPDSPPNLAEPETEDPTAIVLVGGYSGLGIHTMLSTIRFTPGYFKNLVFVSVGVIDSGNFKGEEALMELTQHTKDALAKYVDLANRFGFAATSFMAIGTDPVEELEHLCVHVHRKFPRSIIFAGQLTFSRDALYQRLFHNQTAFSLQRRLQWDGVPMMILPTRVK
ncbi:MAG: APC family permease [Planctomycetota bacterium]|nr:APC family permease [Planctomycetota bacterium]